MIKNHDARDETEYYDSLLFWLYTRGYFVGQYTIRRDKKPHLFKNLGSPKRRCDVAGVRNVGNKYIDEIEIAAIEVKTGPITPRHIQQAFGYTLFAHKCYLATPEHKGFEEQKDVANEFGIGLLKIEKEQKLAECNLWEAKGPFYKIDEVLSPKAATPKSKAEMIDFLDTAGIVQCTVCQCYVFDWAGHRRRPRTVFRLDRLRQLSMMTKMRTEQSALVPFIDDSLRKNSVPQEYHIHRYICLDCARELQKDIKQYLAKNQ